MNIRSLYRDFFRFLEAPTFQADQWTAYNAHYYKPHREFLDVYFSHFPLLNEANLKERVEAVKPADYTQLKNIVSACPPEDDIRYAHKVCSRIVAPQQNPEVFLMIGFFSPDGFVMDFKGKPVICFGLERFKDFFLLKVLFAHEYGHYLLNEGAAEIPENKELKWKLLSEGIVTCFSQTAFPEYDLSCHLFFRRDRLNWCQENESFLREIYCSEKYTTRELLDFEAKGNPDLDLPPRAGKYLGYLAVKNYLSREERPDFGALFEDISVLLSIDL
ncbi:MAG: hypothetical protein JXB26_13075 [Candidatus Aminicenantes bacterium]|nr:hypothetical protein [Candidatus Aminicenantes bacterium]